MNKLQLSIVKPQEMEILIEFPIFILASYKGESNIDETWDDCIMNIINNSLLDSGCIIMQSEINMLTETKDYVGKLVYKIGIIANPPFADLGSIADNLRKASFEKGLCIKIKNNSNSSTTLYSDIFCADRF